MDAIDDKLVMAVLRLECALLDRLQGTTEPLDVPTVVQIADAMGADLRVTQFALKSLADDGVIRKSGNGWELVG